MVVGGKGEGVDFVGVTLGWEDGEVGGVARFAFGGGGGGGETGAATCGTGGFAFVG